MSEEATARPGAGSRCGAHPALPAAFVCERCGDYACQSCLFAEGALGPICARCGARDGGERVAWERLREIGLWAAFWKSSREILTSPTAFFQTTPRPGAGVAALGYGVLTYVLGQLFFLISYFGLIGVGAMAGASELNQGGDVALFAMLLFSMVFALVWMPIQAAIGIAIDAACVHGTLWLTGGARASFEQTLRASAYSNGPYILGLLPCLGIFLGWVWAQVSEIIAIRETHAIGTAHAAFAVLAYRFVLVAVVGLFYAGLFALMLSAFASPPT